MNTIFYCDICNAPMKLDEKLSNHVGKSGIYRRRRFKCTICDFTKLVYAGGAMDEKIYPERGIKIINNNFKQEEENRNVQN